MGSLFGFMGASGGILRFGVLQSINIAARIFLQAKCDLKFSFIYSPLIKRFFTKIVTFFV